MLEDLYKDYHLTLRVHKQEYRRYIFDDIDPNEKMIGILGARGVGKTTLMLQLLKSHPNYLKTTLYVNMDGINASKYSIYEIAEIFYKYGGRALAIDEIHRYGGFEKELKAIYDTFGLQLIFSGSSALHLEHARGDLSRRAVIHRMVGLSFREFLELETKNSFAPFALGELLENHIEIASKICSEIKPLGYFKSYLEYGYYPFYLESKKHYPLKLQETINLSLESDIGSLFGVSYDKVSKFKKLLVSLCESSPTQVNIAKLASMCELNRNTVYSYLDYMQKASLVNMLRSHGANISAMSKPDKLYLGNPNISNLLCSSPNTGTIRELFFLNAVGVRCDVAYPKQGDFVVEGKYLFEVGGKSKGFEQIKDVDDSYLAVDEIEVGFKNKIPLWVFGFLY